MDPSFEGKTPDVYVEDNGEAVIQLGYINKKDSTFDAK
jgi:hypothetical protein